jgi:membrane fusion protein, multidrug efflux system
VTVAQASIQNIDAQISGQQAQVAQNVAQVQQAQASLTFAQRQEVRYSTLAHDGPGTMQQDQQWSSQERPGEAGLKSAQSGLVATARQLSALKAQSGSADTLDEATAQRNQAARLNLSYTRIRAPVDGVGLMAVVPLSQVYVVANYREVQLEHVKAGQPATIRVDAYIASMCAEGFVTQKLPVPTELANRLLTAAAFVLYTRKSKLGRIQS